MRARSISSLAIGLAAAVIFILLPFNAQASVADSSGIYINEIMWSGSSASTADEFIEIINTSDKIIDISGYSVKDQVNSKEMLKIDQGQIAPQGKFLIANYSSEVENTIINVEPDLVDNDISLSNEKFQIALIDPYGLVIDIAGDGQKPFYYKEISSLQNEESIKYKASIERKIFADGALIGNWQISSNAKNLKKVPDLASPEKSSRPKIKYFKALTTGYAIGLPVELAYEYEAALDEISDVTSIGIVFGKSPELKVEPRINSVTLAAQQDCQNVILKFYSKEGLSSSVEIELDCYFRNPNLRFSEILTSPSERDWDGDGSADSRDEWIELYNNSTEFYNLNGWKILDASGKSFNLNGQIAPFEYKVFYSKVTGLSLNNNGEKLALYDPGGEVIDHVLIPALASNISFAWFANWEKTNQPTPSFENQHSIESYISRSDDSPSNVEVISEKHIDEPENNASNIQSDMNIIYEERVITHAATLNLSETSKIEVPKLDGSMVLSAQSFRSSKAFNFDSILVYLLAVILITAVVLIYLVYEFYRLE